MNDKNIFLIKDKKNFLVKDKKFIIAGLVIFIALFTLS